MNREPDKHELFSPENLMKLGRCVLCGERDASRRMRDGICSRCLDDAEVPGFDTDRRKIPMGLPSIKVTGLWQLGGRLIVTFAVLMALYGIIKVTARLIMGV